MKRRSLGFKVIFKPLHKFDGKWLNETVCLSCDRPETHLGNNFKPKIIRPEWKASSNRVYHGTCSYLWRVTDLEIVSWVLKLEMEVE